MNYYKKAKVIIKNLARVFTKKSALINLNLIATNLCNQRCPMCNTSLMRNQKSIITLSQFKKYLHKLKSYHLASCTISGGEPTLVKDLPEIIEEASRCFPFGVLLITNLYGNTKQVMRSVESALRNNINLSISFDGFGEVADKLRGAKNVSASVEKHIAMVHDMQRSLNSRSAITLHSVITDLNIPQMPGIFEYSKKLGWKHTIAPVNAFYYQESEFEYGLNLSQELIDVCERALVEEHVDMKDAYIKGIALYAQKKSPKLCPYLNNFMRTYKFFLEPGGDVSLCDRTAIGNLNSRHIDDMVKSLQYRNSLAAFEKCEGCWMACFVEPHLMFFPSNGKDVRNFYEIVKKEKNHEKEKDIAHHSHSYSQ